MAFMSCSSRVVSARCAQVLRPDTRVMVARAGREHPAASRAPPRLVPLSGVGAAVLARRGCAGRRAVRAAAAGQVDRHLEVKLGIAQGTGKLDLSEMGLTEIPAEVFYLTELTDLSLAGNAIEAIPPQIANLTSLERLQVAGNRLQGLPHEIGALQRLEGLWVHGNLLSSLPDSICQLTALRVVSAAGNRLSALPAALGNLAALEDMGLPGNQLEALPESIGNMKALRKLSLHGNRLKSVPASLGQLAALQELWLMGNDLDSLPDCFTTMTALKELSLADNCLAEVPPSLAAAPALTSLWVYGNALTRVPHGLAEHPTLKYLWLEGNPLSEEGLEPLLSRLSGGSGLRAVGVDEQQASLAPPELVSSAVKAEQLSVSRVIVAPDGAAPVEGPAHHSLRGYFKLQPGTQFVQQGSPRVLVVAFGSAPGTPNWAGVLKQVAGEAKRATAGRFDTLYVVDACRSWYGGGDGGEEMYRAKLATVAACYDEVVMIGDSMGATAALLFSDLATSVHAFCPQVDLATASIRPGQPPAWLAALKDRLLAAAAASSADITVHSGTWQHDLDQAVMVEPHSTLRVYDVDSHRLALRLASQGKLLPIIRDSVFGAMRKKEDVRLGNLL